MIAKGQLRNDTRTSAHRLGATPPAVASRRAVDRRGLKRGSGPPPPNPATLHRISPHAEFVHVTGPRAHPTEKLAHRGTLFVAGEGVPNGAPLNWS